MADRGRKDVTGPSKTKYQSLNLNQSYRGQKPDSRSGGSRHGMQSLGKVGSNARRLPPPARLPSMRKENAGNDANVSLVPAGGSGWGGGRGEKENGDEAASSAAVQAVDGNAGERADKPAWRNVAPKKPVRMSNRDFPTLGEENGKDAKELNLRPHGMQGDIPPASAAAMLGHAIGHDNPGGRPMKRMHPSAGGAPWSGGSHRQGSYSRPATVKVEDIERLEYEDEEGWAGQQEEVDYTAKLRFEDSDESDNDERASDKRQESGRGARGEQQRREQVGNGLKQHESYPRRAWEPQPHSQQQQQHRRSSSPSSRRSSSSGGDHRSHREHSYRNKELPDGDWRRRRERERERERERSGSGSGSGSSSSYHTNQAREAAEELRRQALIASQQQQQPVYRLLKKPSQPEKEKEVEGSGGDSVAKSLERGGPMKIMVREKPVGEEMAPQKEAVKAEVDGKGFGKKEDGVLKRRMAWEKSGALQRPKLNSGEWPTASKEKGKGTGESAKPEDRAEAGAEAGAATVEEGKETKHLDGNADGRKEKERRKVRDERERERRKPRNERDWDRRGGGRRPQERRQGERDWEYHGSKYDKESDGRGKGKEREAESGRKEISSLSNEEKAGRGRRAVNGKDTRKDRDRGDGSKVEKSQDMEASSVTQRTQKALQSRPEPKQKNRVYEDDYGGYGRREYDDRPRRGSARNQSGRNSTKDKGGRGKEKEEERSKAESQRRAEKKEQEVSQRTSGVPSDDVFVNDLPSGSKEVRPDERSGDSAVKRTQKQQEGRQNETESKRGRSEMVGAEASAIPPSERRGNREGRERPSDGTTAGRGGGRIGGGAGRGQKRQESKSYHRDEVDSRERKPPGRSGRGQERHRRDDAGRKRGEGGDKIVAGSSKDKVDRGGESGRERKANDDIRRREEEGETRDKKQWDGLEKIAVWSEGERGRGWGRGRGGGGRGGLSTAGGGSRGRRGPERGEKRPPQGKRGGDRRRDDGDGGESEDEKEEPAEIKRSQSRRDPKRDSRDRSQGGGGGGVGRSRESGQGKGKSSGGGNGGGGASGGQQKRQESKGGEGSGKKQEGSSAGKAQAQRDLLSTFDLSSAGVCVVDEFLKDSSLSPTLDEGFTEVKTRSAEQKERKELKRLQRVEAERRRIEEEQRSKGEKREADGKPKGNASKEKEKTGESSRAVSGKAKALQQPATLQQSESKHWTSGEIRSPFDVKSPVAPPVAPPSLRLSKEKELPAVATEASHPKQEVVKQPVGKPKSDSPAKPLRPPSPASLAEPPPSTSQIRDLNEAKVEPEKELERSDAQGIRAIARKVWSSTKEPTKEMDQPTLPPPHSSPLPSSSVPEPHLATEVPVMAPTSRSQFSMVSPTQAEQLQQPFSFPEQYPFQLAMTQFSQHQPGTAVPSLSASSSDFRSYDPYAIPNQATTYGVLPPYQTFAPAAAGVAKQPGYAPYFSPDPKSASLQQVIPPQHHYRDSMAPLAAMGFQSYSPRYTELSAAQFNQAKDATLMKFVDRSVMMPDGGSLQMPLIQKFAPPIPPPTDLPDLPESVKNATAEFFQGSHRRPHNYHHHHHYQHRLADPRPPSAVYGSLFQRPKGLNVPERGPVNRTDMAEAKVN